MMEKQTRLCNFLVFFWFFRKCFERYFLEGLGLFRDLKLRETLSLEETHELQHLELLYFSLSLLGFFLVSLLLIRSCCAPGLPRWGTLTYFIVPVIIAFILVLCIIVPQQLLYPLFNNLPYSSNVNQTGPSGSTQVVRHGIAFLSTMQLLVYAPLVYWWFRKSHFQSITELEAFKGLSFRIVMFGLGKFLYEYLIMSIKQISWPVWMCVVLLCFGAHFTWSLFLFYSGFHERDAPPTNQHEFFRSLKKKLISSSVYLFPFFVSSAYSMVRWYQNHMPLCHFTPTHSFLYSILMIWYLLSQAGVEYYSRTLGERIDSDQCLACKSVASRRNIQIVLGLSLILSLSDPSNFFQNFLGYLDIGLLLQIALLVACFCKDRCFLKLAVFTFALFDIYQTYSRVPQFECFTPNDDRTIPITHTVLLLASFGISQRYMPMFWHTSIDHPILLHVNLLARFHKLITLKVLMFINRQCFRLVKSVLTRVNGWLDMNREESIMGIVNPLQSIDEGNANRHQSTLCVVCMHHRIEVVLRPCGHAQLCSSCYDIGKLMLCPTCRAKIDIGLEFCFE